MSSKPKVLFKSSVASAQQTQVVASAPTSDYKKPSVLFGTAQASLPKSTQPKVLAGGVLRRRIPCRIEDLQALNPSADAKTLTAALNIVHRVNLDDPHFEDIVRFGEDLQIEHGHMTEIELSIANDERIGQGQMLLNPVFRHIKQLNPEQVFDHAHPSFIQKVAGLVLPKATPRQMFDDYYPQLLASVEQVKNHEQILLQASDTLAKLKPRYTSLLNEITGFTMAANFMASYIQQNLLNHAAKEHYIAQASALENRANSLLNTQTTLNVGRITHEALAENLRALNETIKSVLYEDLPAFHTAYTAALAAVQPSTATLAPLRRVYLKIIKRSIS